MSEERVRVLGMLQQGQITIEQANRLLEALDQSYRAEAAAPPAPPPPMDPKGIDPGTLLRNLGGQIRAQVVQAMGGALKGAGPAGSYSGARITDQYLSGMADGSTYTNYSTTVIADDVSPDLLRQKIGAYVNYGATIGPAALLDILEGRATANYGTFREPGPGAQSRPNRLTREKVEGMADGSSYANYTSTEVAADVPEELLAAKIADYQNYGLTSGPARLLRVLMDRCFANYGGFRETDAPAESERQSAFRANHGEVRFSVDYLTRMWAGTDFANHGTVTVDPEVTEQLLDEKLARYRNHGSTEIPPHLLGYFENRFTSDNYGQFAEPGAAKPKRAAAVPAVADASRHEEQVLTRWPAPEGCKEIAITCAAGNVEAFGCDDDEMTLSVRHPLSGSETLTEGWQKAIPFQPAQEGTRFSLRLGDQANRGLTERLTFRLAIPIEANVSVITDGGNLRAWEIVGGVTLKTGGGDVSCWEIEGGMVLESAGGSLSAKEVEGGVVLKTAGGNIEVAEIKGGVEADTQGGNISICEVEGGVVAKSAGGNISIAEVEGGVIVHTGGGNISATEVEGSVRADTGGGEIQLTEIEGGVSATTGGGNISAREVEGSVKVETGAGDITLSEVEGSVVCRTGAGDIHLNEVEGDAKVETAIGTITLNAVSGQVEQRVGG